MTPREPVTRFVEANGLRHAVHEWDGGGRDTVLLCHGFLDQGRCWDFVVAELPPNWHVVAFDWRGHGRSEWIGRGGYYHFFDYLADLEALAPQVRRERLFLVGHSMGGSAAALYAGARPDRVDRLALLEGLGPPSLRPDDAPARAVAWLDALPAARAPRRPLTAAEATARLRERHRAATPAQLEHLVRHGTRAVDGGLAWAFDPLHRTTSPQPFYLAQAAAFWRRVTCPTLLIEGDASPWGLLPDVAERNAAFPSARRLRLPGVGHMMQVEAPAAVARALVEFLA